VIEKGTVLSGVRRLFVIMKRKDGNIQTFQKDVAYKTKVVTVFRKHGLQTTNNSLNFNLFLKLRN
jgi:hypothetical protein